MTDRHHDLSAVEKAVDTKFAAVLPFVTGNSDRTITMEQRHPAIAISAGSEEAVRTTERGC